MINFVNEKPKARYYVYKEDGCVIKIMTSKPSDKDMDTNGNYFYPYFEHDYYDENGLKIFVKDITLKTPNAVETLEGGTFYKTKSVKTEYSETEKAEESAHGVVTAIPSCTSSGKTYYFDYFINEGDEYKDGKFVAMNRKSTSEEDNYGTLLKDAVINSLSLDAFLLQEANLPSALVDVDNTLFNNVEGYDLVKEDFMVYGSIYCKLLLDYMKKQGEAKVKGIKSMTASSDYSDLELDITYNEKITLTQIKKD